MNKQVIGIHSKKNQRFQYEDVKFYIENTLSEWKKLKLIGEYKNNRTPITLLDDEGYKYFVQLDSLQNIVKRNGVLSKFNTSNIYTIENIHNYLLVNDIQIQLLTNEYKGNSVKMQWKCDQGHIFNLDWGNFSQGRRCNKCAKNRRITLPEVQSLFIDKDLTLLSTEYHKNTQLLYFICNKHQEIGIQQTTWATLKGKNGFGCRICASNKLREDRKMGINEFKKRVYQLTGDEYAVIGNSYFNSQTRLQIKHNTCGYIFEMQPNNFLSGHRCPYCNQSKGEVKVSQYLLNNHILFEKQKTFKDCKYKKLLQFDFYLPTYNICIEYQGEQHYFPVDFANKGKEWAEELFQYNQIRDQIKKEYCHNNQITLIEIPYWESDNIETFLNLEGA